MGMVIGSDCSLFDGERSPLVIYDFLGKVPRSLHRLRKRLESEEGWSLGVSVALFDGERSPHKN